VSKTCEGLCYLCLRPLKLPLAQARCQMPEWDECARAQQQQEADAWYAEMVARMAERAPA
jgi:hypothetical protein